MFLIEERPARRWCEGVAAVAPVEHIRPGGEPYLDRYYLAGWSPHNRRPGPALFLHHFLSSDPAVEVHSHPWEWALSLVLVGGYREERCDGRARVVVEHRPGSLNLLTWEARHRVDLLADDCWTLFLAGTYAAPWFFAKGC